MYTCNMHRISVRSTPPSALGHRSRSRRRGRRASAPGPDTSPYAAALVATEGAIDTRGRGSACTVRRSGPQSKSSGKKQRGSAVEERKEQRRVTVNRGVGRKAGAVGRPTEQEQAGSPSTCGADLSSPSPFPIQPA
jgi:hypothetical protein